MVTKVTLGNGSTSKVLAFNYSSHVISLNIIKDISHFEQSHCEFNATALDEMGFVKGMPDD